MIALLSIEEPVASYEWVAFLAKKYFNMFLSGTWICMVWCARMSLPAASIPIRTGSLSLSCGTEEIMYTQTGMAIKNMVISL